MTPRWLVSHPHAAIFATQAAQGLERAGMLAGYFTGIAVPARGLASWALKPLLRWRPQARNRIVEEIARERLHALFLTEAAARASARIAGVLGLGLPKKYDAIFAAHDAAVAASPWPKGTGAVYAYEDGALRTFRRAARCGLARLWDLPLPHWASLERVWLEEFRRWPQAMGTRPHIEPDWKKRRKEEELSLADAVSVASRHTRKSLEMAGVSKPILVVPYGFPLGAFAAKRGPAQGPFTVLAVGTHDLRKGTPYLLEAWKRVALPDARLLLVGPMKLTREFLTPYQGLFEHVPHVPRVQMASYYQDADLLAFPTLGDGFGLVIQEAMCCATPVLTTPCGGGPECIDDGVEGWIVPGRDIDALVDRLRQAARSRDRLAEMGHAARRRAERWTWRDSGEALATALTRRVS